MTTNNSVNNNLSNPIINTGLLDTNANTWINQGAVGSAVNYVQINNAVTAQQPVVEAAGSDTNVALVVRGQGNAGVAILGNKNGSSYSSGYVGEILSNSTSNTGLTNNTPANATSLSLTAGDWDVWGTITYIPGGATTISNIQAGITTSSATIPGIGVNSSLIYYSWTFTPGLNQVFGITPCQIVISSTTTVYLTCQATFGVSTLAVNGFLMARRRT
jgi:hypothetical protein